MGEQNIIRFLQDIQKNQHALSFTQQRMKDNHFAITLNQNLIVTKQQLLNENQLTLANNQAELVKRIDELLTLVKGIARHLRQIEKNM